MNNIACEVAGMKNKKNTIDKPHDKALFKALENHDVARHAMRAYLPELLLSMTPLKIIRHYKTKLITPEFKEFEADILYEIELEDQSGLILFHCEQQSTVEKYMPLRIWQYLLLVLMEYAKNHPGKPLPIIYPIILYTGEDKYNESTDFFDLFGRHKGLAHEFLLAPVKLVDICRMADEDIKKHRLFGLSEYAFKHKHTKHFEKFLQNMLPWAHQIELQLGNDYVKMVMRYVIDVYPEASYDIFVEEARRYLSEETGGEAMTIAEQLEQRGMQQGMQQSQRKVAKSMLMDSFPESSVVKYTGLSVEVINTIKAELQSSTH